MGTATAVQELMLGRAAAELGGPGLDRAVEGRRDVEAAPAGEHTLGLLGATARRRRGPVGPRDRPVNPVGRRHMRPMNLTPSPNPQ
jgi:hypothetical protein